MAARARKKRRSSKLSAILTWLGHLLSLIGLISIVDNLRSWAKLFSSIIVFLQMHAPALAVILTTIGDFIHAIVVIYRSIFHPPLDIIFGWIDPGFPDIVKDIFIVGILVLYGSIHIPARATKKLEQINYKERVRLSRKANDYEIYITPLEAWQVEHAISDYKYLKRRQESGEELGEYGKQVQQSWNKSLMTFGPALERFADDNMDLSAPSPQLKRLFTNSWRALIAVWVLGGLTALFAIIDAILYN